MKALANCSILTLCCLLTATAALAQDGSRRAASKGNRPDARSQAGSNRVVRPESPGNSAAARNRDRVASPQPSTRITGNQGFERASQRSVQPSENRQRIESNGRGRGAVADQRQREVTDRPDHDTAATGSAPRQNVLPHAGMDSPSEAMARGLRNRLAQIDRMRDKAIETDNAKLLDIADRLEQDARLKYADMSARIAQRQESGKPGVGAPLRNPADDNEPGVDPQLEPIPTEPESEPLLDTGADVPPLDAVPDATTGGSIEEFAPLPSDQP